MRSLLVAVSLLVGSTTSAHAQASVGITVPRVDIGVNVQAYPDLVLVPGYPVYYDPRADSNYFFYDGMYWVYEGDSWYASTWYNGPWQMVQPEDVPLFVLRVPVRYYRRPPPPFRGWPEDAPPRWGDHWGRAWERHHVKWDQWDHRSAPRPAPLPMYQQQYSGDRYPRAMEQQYSIRCEYYRYQPRETLAQQHFKQREYVGGPGYPGPHARRRYAPGPLWPPERHRMHPRKRRGDNRESRNEDRRRR